MEFWHSIVAILFCIRHPIHIIDIALNGKSINSRQITIQQTSKKRPITTTSTNGLHVKNEHAGMATSIYASSKSVNEDEN